MPIAPHVDRQVERYQRLSESVWMFEDTANVYVIRQGDHAALVDFGSGAVLEHLSDLGITGVDWILHTHHHRDQCQGDLRAVELGIPIAVPAHERHLFEDAENFWRNRRVYHMYYVRNDFNTPIANIPVAASLHDYDTFRWRGLEFLVLPSPGHTPGSISLVVDVDGRRFAFSGDLMYAAGKVVTLHDTQHEYGGIEGIDLGADSLTRLADQSLAILCPSHGAPILDPEDAIRHTAAKLVDYLRFMGGDPIVENQPYALTPHLIVSHQSCSTFYAIVSDTGRAMLIDYGSPSSMAMWAFQKAVGPTGRIRFIEHTLDQLRRDHGVSSIDVVMPSHIHDDHINGIPHLVRRYATEVWSLDQMKEVLEHPRGQNLACLLGEPIQVDRPLRSGELFSWEEFEFEVVHSPGHTEYQMALYTTIDGQRVAFTADALYPPDQTADAHHDLVFRNHVESQSRLRAIQGLIDHRPTLLCPGHQKPFLADEDVLIAARDNLRRQQRFFSDLLPEGAVGVGLDPSWVRIFPYQPVVTPGTDLQLEIRVQNYDSAPAAIEATLVSPAAWSPTPAVARFAVPPNAIAAVAVTVKIPTDWTPIESRFAIAADIVANGRHLGQIAEAICEVDGSAPNLESWA
jgi:glyoxylase-like metal-dependent hydrolase (beta-lactamase superfamily II)